jgi:hypothetical protein
MHHDGTVATTRSSFTEMCTASDRGSYPRHKDLVYLPTLGAKLIEKKKKKGQQ